HPHHALGVPNRECFREIWGVIGPMMEGVLKTGKATWSEDLLLPSERSGYLEECYFTFSYSPIRDETGGVGGVFIPVKETTEKVITERRLSTLRELANRGIEPRNVATACRIAAATMSLDCPSLPHSEEVLRCGPATTNADFVLQNAAQLANTAALRDSEAKLAMELADTQVLQRVSSSLIRKNNIDALYGQILDAAHTLMHSDMASLQMLAPERNELFLLAQKGFAPESAKFWEWVQAGDTTVCGFALRRGERVIVPDVEAWDFVAGTEDLAHFRLSGIRAVLSAPLIARDGRRVGIISTHWREVHHPSERELRLLDVLARQVADLIERRTAEEALRESEERMRLAIRATRMVTWEWIPSEDRIT